MFGLGCVAGAAGTARLADYLRGHPDQVGVLLSVELCSLTLQRGDFSVANLIASGLFGDGAAALVGLGENRARDFKGPTVVGAMSRFYPDTERVMGWDVTDTGFQIVLDASDIHTVVAHPGGPKVLTAFEDALCLPEAALARTWASLKDVGNMSSASVLFVLRDTLADTPPPPGAYGLMMAMGPGFCSEFVLLRWDTP
jgi:alkylresorcinol/alkylpyrone synthase